MNDEQIMKEFMDSLKEDKTENVAPYKATSNLNVQLGNPNLQMNNSMDVNIQKNSDIIPQNNNAPLNNGTITTNEVKTIKKDEVSVIPTFQNAQGTNKYINNSLNNQVSQFNDVINSDLISNQKISGVASNAAPIVDTNVSQDLIDNYNEQFFNEPNRQQQSSEPTSLEKQKKEKEQPSDIKFVLLVALLMFIAIFFVIPNASDFLNNFLNNFGLR